MIALTERWLALKSLFEYYGDTDEDGKRAFCRSLSWLLLGASHSAIAAHWQLVAVSADHLSGASVAMESVDSRSGYVTAWVRREHWSSTGEKVTYDLIAFDCKERQLALLRQGLSEEPVLTGPTLSDLPFKPTFTSPARDSIDFTLVSALCGKPKT